MRGAAIGIEKLVEFDPCKGTFQSPYRTSFAAARSLIDLLCKDVPLNTASKLATIFSICANADVAKETCVSFLNEYDPKTNLYHEFAFEFLHVLTTRRDRAASWALAHKIASASALNGSHKLWVGKWHETISEIAFSLKSKELARHHRQVAIDIYSSAGARLQASKSKDMLKQMESTPKTFWKLNQLDQRVCASCLQIGVRLPACKCREIHYCNSACQNSDWIRHKPKCSAKK